MSSPSHAQGGVSLGVVNGVHQEAEGGEYILRRDSVERIGRGTLDYMNATGRVPGKRKHKLGGSYPTVSSMSRTYGSSTERRPDETLSYGRTFLDDIGEGIDRMINAIINSELARERSWDEYLANKEKERIVVNAVKEVVIETAEAVKSAPSAISDFLALNIKTPPFMVGEVMQPREWVKE